MLSRRPSRGFTAIELLVTIAITTLLATLAAPSFKTMLAAAQVRTAAHALLDGLQLARAEAIRRNERVVFNKQAQSTWNVMVESDGTLVQARSFSEGSSLVQVTASPAAASKVTYDGLGRIRPNADASSPIAQLDADAPASMSASGSRALRITVSGAGAARLCDPNAPPGTGRGC
jgi:type IV fimbrial biogenesis protein FimT